MKKASQCLYLSPNILRKGAGHVGRMGEGRSIFKILTVKATGKRLLGNRRHRWENTIGMILKEIGVIIRNWFDLGQG